MLVWLCLAPLQPIFSITSLHRFFIQQKAYDTLAGNQFKDDVKRVEREAKERSQEASLINSLYQVGQ